MTKHWCTRIAIAVIVVITVCLIWRLPSPEGAAWVQAIGSVGAILFTGLTTQRQIASQAQQAKDVEGRAAKRFHDALRAIVDEAARQFLKLEPEMTAEDNDDFSYLSFMFAYKEQSFTDSINALETVRLVDLGSYELVEAIAGMKADMIKLRYAANEAINLNRNKEEQPDHQLKDYGQEVIGRLKHHYGKAATILGAELIQAATWMDDKAPAHSLLTHCRRECCGTLAAFISFSI